MINSKSWVMNGEWHSLISRWLVHLRGGAARPATLSLRRMQLARFAADHARVPVGAITTERIVSWLGSHEWSRETIRSHRSALRSFFTWTSDAGIVSGNPAMALPKVAAATPAPRPASEDTVRDALARADDRARLMLLLGRRLGMRRGEISRLHTQDLGADAFGMVLRVQGKGGKVRTVPVGGELSRILRRVPAGWVFPGRDGHLTAAHVGKVMRRAMAGEATAHQLRHSFATHAFAGSSDIVSVSRLLGHASVATTQRYVATDAARLRAVMDGAA